MVKFVLAALWISVATVGAVFFSFQMSQAENSADPMPGFFGGLDYVRTDVVSVPVVKGGGVDGYFLARLVYTVEPEKRNALSLPLETLIIDQLYSYLYGNPQVDFSKHDEVDLDALREGVRLSLNERVGDELVHDVLIEQVDYLSKEDIRDNAIRRRLGTAG
ncbi:hypothetical protein [Chelativorans sp. YIM 93263]|uniref:hypothetical protein n=1 Tax=Chelativorans sp. YIM 93263 TaxID=2906648 RepID=UPI0023781DBB|nr:hypothetical protein [Chelativorans sp. YIM 93263]